MNDHTIECVADADTACFGIVNDGCSLSSVSVFVKICMADACTCFYHRYGGILSHEVDQSTATAGNQQIYLSGGRQKLVRRFAVSRQQLDGVGVCIKQPEHIMYHFYDGAIRKVGIATAF